MSSATAPGKIILFGEHAVVYGQPAIAAPLSQVRAKAVVKSAESDITLILPDLKETVSLSAHPSHPLAAAVEQARTYLQHPTLPPMSISVTSAIPIASGLGSGAAIAAALIRAIVTYLDEPPSDQTVCDLTYEVEKLFHGTPSGIDNTVVAFEKPVYFMRQKPKNMVETFVVGKPLHLLVADTGVRSSTKAVVGDVRRQWEADKTRFEQLFTECGALARAAQSAIERGDSAELGHLMQRNHAVLQRMTVSSAELDHLVNAAMQAGAIGAKMSGAGRGGNLIALVEEGAVETIKSTLLQAGATHILQTTLLPST